MQLYPPSCNDECRTPRVLCPQEKLYPPDQLPALMAECDYVVMATPHTPSTHKMVGREALEAMRPHAVFVNVGRGKCVDEPALVEGGRGCVFGLYGQHDLGCS